jgi:hypothetical protein
LCEIGVKNSGNYNLDLHLHLKLSILILDNLVGFIPLLIINKLLETCQANMTDITHVLRTTSKTVKINKATET